LLCLTISTTSLSKSAITNHHHLLVFLVKVNKPNLLLFVGEALVGNDGIDQLTMFNKVVVPCLLSYTITFLF
jgi:hypothetical protein